MTNPRFTGLIASLRAASIGCALCGLGCIASADTTFSDNFDAGPSPAWGNERGAWIASGGVYFATIPNNLPPTLSSLPYGVGSGSIELDVLGVKDGGVWVHLDGTGNNGVLLVTGGNGGTGRGLYWHTVHNNSYSPILNPTAPLFNTGDNIHIKVVANGNNYAVYLNGSVTPATTIQTPDFPVGRFGLYDFASPQQSFDNVVVTRTCPADFNNDGVVNTVDLTYLLSRYGLPPVPAEAADLNFDNAVDTNDLVFLLGDFGIQCP